MYSFSRIVPIGTPICKPTQLNPPLLPDSPPGNHPCPPTNLITVVKAYVAFLTFRYIVKSPGVTIIRWMRPEYLGGTLFTRKYLHRTYADIDTSSFNILIPDKVTLHDQITITQAQRICHISHKLITYSTIAVSNNIGFHQIIYRECK